MKTTQEILAAAKNAVPQLLTLTAEEKNSALLAMADALEQATAEILAANALDMEAARGHISEVMLDRLALTEGRIADMAKGIREVVALPDPVGRVIAENTLPNGLQVQRISVPMGVIAIIYESRPNVTSDAAALALKAGSACVLRGGKEAYRSAHAIVTALQRGLAAVGLPETAVNLIEDTTRQSATDMMQAVGYIDLLIPRGGAGLIRSCVENALVPCIQTGTGICHIYVDDSADLEKALNIIENAKMSRPSVCNAAEVCLVHKAVAAEFLPKLKARLTDPKHPHPAQLRLDERALAIIDGVAATEEDFDTEFLDYVLAVKVVDSTADAIAHIGAHSTHHSDAIITENDTAAQLFTRLVDSAAVYVNASTRFTDGGQFGLGCEMGISTQKLHARGPMGLEELTTYKYVVKGSGQIR
ncbi:MAG: glutamate-5-semialdehyde dehydrogenase [Oscillospiraceae bacterium]|nr:glutamate-5-semialdehyde dehydrogenase [Oscillospiraceae bacterium]